MSNFNFYSPPYYLPSPPVYNTQPILHSPVFNPPDFNAASTPSVKPDNVESEASKKTRDKWSKAQTHRLVALWKENFHELESGKSRQVYIKMKTEIDGLGTAKTSKQIREKLRNLKDNYKRAKENNNKSGASPEFPAFYHDFDEMLSDRDVMKIPELKQIGCKKPVTPVPEIEENSTTSSSSNTEESSNLEFTGGESGKSIHSFFFSCHFIPTHLYSQTSLKQTAAVHENIMLAVTRCLL